MRHVSVTSAERDALYAQAMAELTVFEDLLQAAEAGDLEQAYRLGLRCSDALRLIVDGLGWGEHASNESVELKIPVPELRRMLSRLQDTATVQYESERAEQEDFRSHWDQVGLVRDTCTAKLEELRTQPEATPVAQP